MKLLLFRNRWLHPVSGSIHQHFGDESTSLQWRHPIGPFLRSVVAFNPARWLWHGADKPGDKRKAVTTASGLNRSQQTTQA